MAATSRSRTTASSTRPTTSIATRACRPTPICSPSLASIRAAMAPARHNYVYYVALPDRTSLFAATYEEHKKNIEKRKEALKR